MHLALSNLCFKLAYANKNELSCLTGLHNRQAVSGQKPRNYENQHRWREN